MRCWDLKSASSLPVRETKKHKDCGDTHDFAVEDNAAAFAEAQWRVRNHREEGQEKLSAETNL